MMGYADAGHFVDETGYEVPRARGGSPIEGALVNEVAGA